jgi:predicted ferric reductase
VRRDALKDRPSYDWSRIPGILDPQAEIAELAALRRHAALKSSLERGRTFRLWLAAPLFVWSFTGMAVMVLVVVVAALHLAGVAEDLVLTWDLAGLSATVIVLEVVVLWSATLLIRDRIRPRSWATVAALAVVALAVATVLLVRTPEVQLLVWLGYGAGVYALIIAVEQYFRARRLVFAERAVDERSP